MTGVFSIMNMARWAMGDYQVDTPFEQELKIHAANCRSHLLLSELITTPIIPPAARESHDTFVLEYDEFFIK